MGSKSKLITLTAIFIATGILFPILFHMISLGKAMLPMFWPVAIAGFMLPLPYACFIGFCTPLLSMILTGMPPISPPVMQVIMLELIALVSTIRILYKKTSWGIVWILILGLISSRLILIAGTPLLAWSFGLPRQWFLWTRLIESLPGMITMLVLIPLFIQRIMHQPLLKGRKDNEK